LPYSNLSPYSNYTYKKRINLFLKLYPITVIEGGDNNPCAGIGDSNGDGICDDVDNCSNTPNADQADDDNNGMVIKNVLIVHYLRQWFMEKLCKSKDGL